MASAQSICFHLSDESIRTFELTGESDEALALLSPEEAVEMCEAQLQLREGEIYEYKITGCLLEDYKGIVRSNPYNPNCGRVTPNNYVGTLTLNVVSEEDRRKIGELKLEVRSRKLDYRSDYRMMLESIAEKCNELLMQANSPVTQQFSSIFTADAQSLYQRFAFLKSIIDSSEFHEAVGRIISSPVSRWQITESKQDIRNVKRISRKTMLQLGSIQARSPLPPDHYLHRYMDSIPDTITGEKKVQHIDTPENRFIKHALSTFLNLFREIQSRSNTHSRLYQESGSLTETLDLYLSNPIFREISRPDILPLNSPILQRKEGYREILRTWLMFELASKLAWQGGEDVYSGGKRDVAMLYEYWVFFKLLDLVKDVFSIDPENISELIVETSNGLGLVLKHGTHLALKGVYESPTRLLNVEFSYNRSFSGDSEYSLSGSWSKGFRPDYTLTVWPHGIDQKKAEKEEVIVHIHFDAKYRVEKLESIFVDEPESGETESQDVKRTDLLKMHAYRDAIRRTGGAYVIYPGTESKSFQGFHEIIPGLGAFTMKPGRDAKDCEAIKDFMRKVVSHLLNRTSQRERASLKNYQIYSKAPDEALIDSLPEPIGGMREYIPDEVYVIVAWYKSHEHLRWIEKNLLYNARMDAERGSLNISPELSGAKYILLHGPNEYVSGRLYRVKQKGPRVFSGEALIKLDYPGASRNFYLVFDLEKLNDKDKALLGIQWDISQLGNYIPYRGSPLPFVVRLSDLMRVKGKQPD